MWWGHVVGLVIIVSVLAFLAGYVCGLNDAGP